MTSKTTVTLPAGTVLSTTKELTLPGGHTVAAHTEVTLGEEVEVEVGAGPGNELPGSRPGGGQGGQPGNELPGQGSTPGRPDNTVPGAQPKR
jgi:hypothetical protein